MLTSAERAALIAQYAAGPDRLRDALAQVPAEAVQWRPAPDAWSVHEVIVHCGDSETQSASRIRQLLADPEPLIVGYDEAAWASRLDYHGLPLESALAAVAASRANTVPLLQQMTESDWQRFGRHSQSGRYSAEDWLRIYAVHLDEHSAQIKANLAAWHEQSGD